MSTARSDASSARRRLILPGLAAAFVAFAAYGSFVPLRWNAVPLDAAVAQFAQTPFIPLSRASRSDFLTNVLLFVPIGFLLLGVAGNRSRGWAAVWFVPVVLVCLAFSAAIEFGQIFVSGRTPSWNDVFAETLGGALGALAWAVVGPAWVDWLAEIFRSESQSDRVFRLLGAYTALWVVLGLQPFDYTLRPEGLAQKFRAGRIVLEPFGSGFNLSDVVGTLLMAVPVGIFGVLAAVHRKAARPAVLGLGIAIGAACLVEFAQLLAVSRTADVTDLLVNGAGGALGVFLATRALAAPLRPGGAGGIRLWPLAALTAWCVVLIARHWTPFDFVADGRFVRSRLPLMFRVPFHSYYWAMPISAFAEASAKLLLGIPVGALLQWMWLPTSRGLLRAQAIAIALLSGALFLGIELGQLLLPTRVPDQTDVYIGTAGAIVGLIAVRLVMRNGSSTEP
jgi:glycopeptide antibiotics resistance protein